MRCHLEGGREGAIPGDARSTETKLLIRGQKLHRSGAGRNWPALESHSSDADDRPRQTQSGKEDVPERPQGRRQWLPSRATATAPTLVSSLHAS